MITNSSRLLEFYAGVHEDVMVCVCTGCIPNPNPTEPTQKIQNIYFVDHNLHLYLTIEAINNDSQRSKRKNWEKKKKENFTRGSEHFLKVFGILKWKETVRNLKDFHENLER